MTDKVKSFNVGDFIAGYRFEDYFVVGVIVSSSPEDFLAAYYDLLRQKPNTKHNNNTFFPDQSDPTIKKITRKKALQFLQEKWNHFEDEIKTGGLTGALTSRKQYSLDQAISCIKSAKDPTVIENKVIEVPRTGIYVLEGEYNRRRDEDRRFLDGLVMKPRQDEELVKEVMELLYKGGTENIPPTCGRGDLSGYEVTEIPKKGIKLVKPRLIIDISEKRVS